MGRISPEVSFALKEALAAIYWRKQDLRSFVQNSISNLEVVNSIDWTQTKFESCSQLVDRMSLRQEIYQEDLFCLIKNITQISDFSHLQIWDNGAELIRKATSAVSRLQTLSKKHIDDFSEYLSAQQNRKSAQERIQKTKDYQRKIDELYTEFSEIIRLQPQQRGYSFESFLNDLFFFFDLAPRGSFKIKGEQIDGAFTHDGTDYLLEAKWRNEVSANADLYAFAGKIGEKLKNTLGVFISMSGFSEEAVASNAHINKAMILIDGRDIMAVLENRISLPDMIRIKRRHAAETGEIMFHVQL